MQTPSTRPKMTQEQARKTLTAWFRSLIIVLLLFLPTRMFLQAGKQIDLNKNLFVAIRQNDANRVAFLLKAGAEANAREPLHDNRSMLKQIYDRLRGVADPPGWSPLQVYLSSERDDKEPKSGGKPRPENVLLLQALLDHHADPNVYDPYNRYTPLITAAMENKDHTIQLLLKHGADVNAKDVQGESALQVAVWGSDIEAIRLLLDGKADVNIRDLDQRTPLMDVKSVDIAQLLIAHGADVNAKDSSGHSVLTHALQAPSSPVIAVLKAAGAK